MRRKGPGDTPSRRRIFVSRPAEPRRRGRCREADPGGADAAGLSAAGDGRRLQGPLALYRKARRTDDFDAGIEMALSAVLVSPQFLFRVEQDPAGVAPDTPYRVSDLELASRLSFFLWSSIPDDELLDVAVARQAPRAGGARAAGAAHAGRRAVARAGRPTSRRSGCTCAISTSITPDMRLFPDFDDNLRQAFRAGDRAVLRERPARGPQRARSAARRLHVPQRAAGEALRHPATSTAAASGASTLDEDSERGGLLRQGSILTVTSYATRTSPVLRGKWVLDNMLGVPPPPPLPERAGAEGQHGRRQPLRCASGWPSTAANAVCATLPQPDGSDRAVAREVRRRRPAARRSRAAMPIDASGGLPDGSKFAGVARARSGAAAPAGAVRRHARPRSC